MGNIDKIKSTIKGWRLGDYFRQFSIVAAGIIVTFWGSDKVTEHSRQKEVRAAMQLVAEELEYNRKELRNIKHLLDIDRNMSSLLIEHKMDISGIPADTLSKYDKLFNNMSELSYKTDALDVLKGSSLMQYISDKRLLQDVLLMIEDAEARGVLKPGATIIEPTSGNTGVGLAMVSTIKGYHLILTMPETMSLERRNLLKALGAQIVLTDGLGGMAASIAKAEELRDSIPGSVILQQFENPANAAVHERTTGEEIWKDTDGEVAAFVAGVGTGGTICGVARALKKHNPKIHVVAVEPAASPVLEGGEAAPHRIQGIGANFIPTLYDASVVDEVISVPDDEAIRAGRELAATEGLLAGISSGAAVYAARLLAGRPEFKNKKIVALLPDTGERYLSTELFAFDAYPLD